MLFQEKKLYLGSFFILTSLFLVMPKHNWKICKQYFRD